MKVLVLGGTGTIGAAVVEALLARRHEVTALARTAASLARMAAAGCRTIAGDVREPASWIAAVDSVDAVVQAVGDFAPDAVRTDRALVIALLARLARHDEPKTYLYTGGCWLYGSTGDRVATEESPFQAPGPWAWTVDHLTMVLKAQSCRAMVIHPAMVYERDGGVLEQFRHDLATRGHVRVIGSESVRWPMVHRRDIGLLYALALEKGRNGASYNGAGVDSVPVGELARAMARRAGTRSTPVVRSVEDAVSELGEWAVGYAIDQQMSGAKARRELGWVAAHPDPIADIS